MNYNTPNSILLYKKCLLFKIAWHTSLKIKDNSEMFKMFIPLEYTHTHTNTLIWSKYGNNIKGGRNCRRPLMSKYWHGT